MERILINATQPEELRLALVSGQRLSGLDFEHPGKGTRGNIYKGVITRKVPGLGVAFVDYGCERHGFLPFKEIDPKYFQAGHEQSDRTTLGDYLREG